MVIDLKCPECEGKIKWLDGEQVCTECGLVIEETQIQNGFTFADVSDKTGELQGYGNPNKFGNLSTCIGDKVNGRGKKRLTNHHKKIARINRWQRKHKYEDALMEKVIDKLKNECSKLNISNEITRDIIKYFEKAYKKNLTRGRAEEVVYSSVIYLVCRINKLPVTVDELAERHGVCPKQISRYYNMLRDELSVVVPLHEVSTYVEKYSSALDVPKKIMIASKKLAKSMEKKMTGKKPSGVAGACIYYESEQRGYDLSVSKVSDVCNVSWNTVFNRYKEICTIVS